MVGYRNQDTVVATCMHHDQRPRPAAYSLHQMKLRLFFATSRIKGRAVIILQIKGPKNCGYASLTMSYSEYAYMYTNDERETCRMW